MLAANPEMGFVCGAMLIADQDQQLTGEISAPPQIDADVFWRILELDFPVMPLCVVVCKECFLRVGLLNRNLRGIDDWDMLVRIAELYPVMILNEPVGCECSALSITSAPRAADSVLLRSSGVTATCGRIAAWASRIRSNSDAVVMARVPA